MMTRREAIARMSAAGAGAVVAATRSRYAFASQLQSIPPLAAGAPTSPERLALIEAFKKISVGVDTRFEARSHQGDFPMPYRLFRPEASGKLPLILFLHGSGGLGTDNQKQMGLGNIFGTRAWALPETQKRFPCYVVVPQTDRGWVHYGAPSPGDSVAPMIPGLGDGARAALEVVDALVHELPIDERRVYVMGQSMGGGGTWHMTAERPGYFAAAVTCCGSATLDDAARSAGTPLWNFHGDADQTVPVAVSRERIALLRKAGAHPIHTEYSGVGHNVWEWAFTEPELAKWVFAQRRA